MKIAYYAETDSLDIDLAAGPSVESREVSAERYFNLVAHPETPVTVISG